MWEEEWAGLEVRARWWPRVHQALLLGLGGPVCPLGDGPSAPTLSGPGRVLQRRFL